MSILIANGVAAEKNTLLHAFALECPAGNLKVICVNPFAFNRYVGDFLQEKPEMWFIKMLRNQFGEFSYYLNHIAFKIKNADF